MKQIIRVAVITILVLIMVQFIFALFLMDKRAQDEASAKAEYEKYSQHRQKIQDDSVRHSSFINGVKRYYAENGVLPRFVSEIDCGEEACAAGVKDGIYYLQLDNGGMAIKPVVNNEVLSFICNSDVDGFNCYHKLSTKLPEFPRASISCSESGTAAEKLVCESDRLTHSQLLLESAYEQLVNTRRKSIFTEYASRKQREVAVAASTCADTTCYNNAMKKYRAERDGATYTKGMVDKMVCRECGDELCVIDALQNLLLITRKKLKAYEEQGVSGNKDRVPMSHFLEYVNADEERQIIAATICENRIKGVDAIMYSDNSLSIDRELTSAYRSLASIEADHATDEILDEKDAYLSSLFARCQTERCIDISLKEKVLELGISVVDDEVIIADPALETCIRGASRDKSVLEITLDSFPVQYLSHLECIGKDINTLAGLEQFRSLNRINLSHNKISDISPLQSLGLVTLDLKGNSINDLSPLANKSTLIELNIRDNPVVDISPVTTLSRIKQVTLSDHNAYSCLELQNLASRENLKIQGKRVLDECDGKSRIAVGPEVEIDCTSMPVNFLEQAICSDKLLQKYDMKEKKLYRELAKRQETDDSLKDWQLSWMVSLNQCETHNCLYSSYLSQIRKLEMLSHSKFVCETRDVPVVAYQSVWAGDIRDDLPVDTFTQFAKGDRKVFYFTELLGAAGREITHKWYRNGVLISEKTMTPSTDKAKMWSTIPDTTSDTDVWEVRTIDQSGCEVMASLLPLGIENITMDFNRSVYLLGKKEFLESEAAIEGGDPSGLKVIKHFAKNKNFEYLYSRNYIGDTPLLQAIRVGNIEALKVLLQDGATPYVWDEQDKSALVVAQESGKKTVVDIIKAAMENNYPDWTIVGSYLETKKRPTPALMEDYLKDPVVCNTMTYLAKGHKITHVWEKFNLKTKEWIPAFRDETIVATDYQMVKSLHKLPEISADWRVHIQLDGNEYDVMEFHSSHRKISGNDFFNNRRVPSSGPLNRLAQAWAPVEYYQAYFESIGNSKLQVKSYKGVMLGVAAISGNVRVLREILEDGTSLHDSLISQALQARRHEVMRYLIAAGLDVNKMHSLWNGPDRMLLHMAAANDDVMAVRLLVENASEIDVRDGNSNTPLHLAAIGCNLDAAKELLQSGASEAIMTSRQETAEKLAQMHKCKPDSAWSSIFSRTDSMANLK